MDGRDGGADVSSAAHTGTRRRAAGAGVGTGAGNGDGDGGGAEGSSVTTLMRLAAGDLRNWRNLLVAPLTEEFVFRACMVPLLVLEGFSNTTVVLLTPLFFGAAHLHHLAEHVRHQHIPLKHALIMVTFQLTYTTIFGWLAAYLFLRTGHLAAPVAAHMFCNWAGFPPFGEMAAHPRGSVLIITTVAGAAAFWLALPRMTAPKRFQQDFYEGWPDGTGSPQRTVSGSLL